MNLGHLIVDFCFAFENDCRAANENLAKQLFCAKFKILFAIFKHKSISQKQLCQHICMAKPNVAMFCKQLKQDGLILTSVDQCDKRIIYYSLTDSGTKMIDQITKQLENHINSQSFAKTIETLKNVWEENKNA